jgi:hypothetical protein
LLLKVLLLLMLLRTGSNLSILLIEYADDTGSNFMMNDGFVVLTNNIDTEFLSSFKTKIRN